MVLQNGIFAYSTWHVYENGSWKTYFADGLGMDLDVYPRAAVVGAGRRLHIRLNAPRGSPSRTTKQGDISKDHPRARRKRRQDGGVGCVLPREPAKP
jgi:hypothetical protein